MITVSINDRKAVLLKTEDLPSGNDSIPVKFIFSDSDPVWNNARKIAMFSAVTPRGLRKSLPAVINKNNECVIPGKILSTPFSIVKVGAMAAYEDGSTVSTNLVFLNKTDAGAGGDNFFEEELPIDKNDFDMFLAELAASIDVQMFDLKSDMDEIKPVAKKLGIDDDGNLNVNGETVLDYSQLFHLMSRQSELFKVETYWDLLEYDASEELTDPETGERYLQLRTIDLLSGTMDGDSVFVQRSKGNNARREDIADMLDFLPSLNVVYPIIHFWQNDLPVPSESEEKEEAYALFATKDGLEYKIHRYFSSEYGVWVVEFSMNSFEGSWFYSWESTSLLEKNSYVFIKDGEKVSNPIDFWPIASDVKCLQLKNPDKLSYLMFNHIPKNIHPSGRYVFDGNIKKWKRNPGDMTSLTFTLSKDNWSWGNRKTLEINGCIPSDEIYLSVNESNIKLSVVGQGYNHITVEASELPSEDLKVTMAITNTVERNDTFGTWSDY